MKILHLEDDACDAELIRIDVQREWPDGELRLVATRDEFLAQLDSGGHDIVLCDFNLVNFNGLEALKLAREKLPAVPFIFLSGTIGEDRAVEALRSGASDYILKDRPKRLVPAIRRALEEAKQRRDRMAAEEQLLRVQRLENIGMLAAGIAHDFNNVLAPVMMAVPMLRDRLRDRTDLEILANVESSVERGADLVRQIMGFAHGVTGEPQVIQPKHVLRDLFSVLRQTFPVSIQIQEALEPDLWPLRVNPTQLHQVLLNLCVNARDAMPQGGSLCVRAGNRQLDAAGAAGIPGGRPGPYLIFEVADTGTGIAANVLGRIWEPFFTTKEAGRGTGLGLPTVRGIVESHQGVIKLHSRVGRGTTFQVFLPAVPSAELLLGPGSAVPVPRGSGELLLVVDDDENVRDVTAAMLTRHGYRVLAAANGTEAVALFAPRSLEIRVVVTDLSMPVLDGIALAQVVHRLNPSTRLLAISGVPGAGERLRAEHLSDPFLSKPFTAETLLGKIHELLTSGSAPAQQAPAA